MRTILIGLLAAAGVAIATPNVPASAQVTVDTPVGGVTVGHRHHYYRDYDSPRYRAYARSGGSTAMTDHLKEFVAATKISLTHQEALRHRLEGPRFVLRL
jgi:hypothetical protein